MKAILSGIFSEITGAAGGITIQKSYGGLQIHLKGQPKIKRTPARQNAKNAFKNVQSTWKTLSTTERGTWIAAAPSGTSGFELYSKTNLRLVNGGLPIINSYTTPVTNPPTPILPQVEQTFNASGILPTLDRNINYLYFDVPQGDWVPYYLWTGWISPSQYRYPPINKKMGPLAVSPSINNVDIIFTNDTGVGGWPPAENWKMKYTEAYVNTVTGQIYTVGTFEVIATSFPFPTPIYNPSTIYSSSVFTPGIPTNTFTATFTSAGNLFDPTTWAPWFYFNNWGTPGDEGNRIVHTPIPVSAVTFADNGHLTIHWSSTAGDTTPIPSTGQTTLINIGWKNIGSGLTEFETQYIVTAVTH